MKNLSHLIKKQVLVTRGNKTFYQTVYVSPEGHEEKETPIGGEIADLDGLKISQYSDKSVLISGDTFKHLEVLRDLKNQLGVGSWNKSLNGWVFPSVHKDTVLGKFVSILGKELEQEEKKEKDNHLFSAFKEQIEIEIHNTIQEKNVIPIDTKVKTTRGNGVIVGYDKGIYKIELDDKVRTYWLEETEFEVLPASVEVAQTILENATPENRFGAEKQIEGKPILDEKKEEEYKFTPDSIKVTTPSGEVVDVIDFSKALPKYLINIPSEENILDIDKPSYIPDVDENLIKRRQFILNFVQLENDKFLVQTHVNDAYKKEGEQYIVVNLDGLVVTHEYYKRKAQATNDKQASEQSERTISRWENMSDDRIMSNSWGQPITKKQYVENTKFTQLPKSIQKKVGSEENWLKMSYEQKKTVFNPYATKFRGEKIKVMQFGKIKVDNFHSYTKFIDKNYKPDLTKKYYVPDVFTDQFNEISEAILQKSKDIQMQREEMSQQYEKAMQTSFGDTNLESDLKKDHGVFIKKQDGKKLSLDEKEQLGKSLNLIKDVFGDKKIMSESFGLKIVHSGTKQIFANRAIGLYSPTFKSISVSSKYGDSKFGFTMAHEYSHFFDNYVGDKQGRRFASDDYNSTAGKIAKEFRKNMNKESDSIYINRTCECFARAFEQHFAHKTEGENVIKIDSAYKDHPDHVSYSVFKEKIEPLIEQFLNENKHILKSLNFNFDFDTIEHEDQFILDLIKAQNTYAGDPSHGGKLVKKQIIDKNGKKQTEWVRPADFNKPINKDKKQDQLKDQSNNSEDEKPNTDFIDNLANEDKAKLELIKEMIDSGDHINAKQLADGLSDEVKHFIPKDVWKQMHEQDQIENNGVKVEGEGEKFLSSLIKPEDVKATLRNFGKVLDKYDISNVKMTNVKLSQLKPTQHGEDRINASSIEEAKNMRELVSGNLDVEDMRKEDLYPIIVDSKTNEILDGNHRYSAYEMNGYKTIPTIFVTPKAEDKKTKKS